VTRTSISYRVPAVHFDATVCSPCTTHRRNGSVTTADVTVPVEPSPGLWTTPKRRCGRVSGRLSGSASIGPASSKGTRPCPGRSKW
jgi:hypothetical protein